MKIYIVRHAIAVDREDFQGEDDGQRPLTDKGRKKMKKIVRTLRQLGLKLDVIVSSPYVRARDTAEILAEGLKMADKVAFTESLVPPGDFEKLIGEINSTYNVDSLALVGHEPVLSQFISRLMVGNPDASIMLKKGGVCCLTTDNLSQEHRATLEWLLTPALMLDLLK